MKKLYFILAAIILNGSSMLYAQSNNKGQEVITVTNEKGQKEDIDLPEAMTDELDSLLRLYNAKIYLKPDTGCNMPDINPLYEKEVYMDRLKRLPTIIEMPYNDVIQKFIERYSGKLRRSVSYMMGAQNFYMPIF